MTGILPLWIIVASPFVGSFLGTVVLRANGSFLKGRSICNSCGHALASSDLVPLLSWLWLGGRCRYCRVRLSIFYPGVELAAVAVAVWAALVTKDGAFLTTVVFGWLLLVLSIIDCRTRRLPDFLTFTLVAFGIATAWLDDRAALTDHIAGAVLGFAAFAIIRMVYVHARHQEGLGLGDAKLLAGIGAYVTWMSLPGVIFIASITAITYALLRQNGLKAGARIPFGPFLSAAAWLAWLYGAKISYVLASMVELVPGQS